MHNNKGDIEDTESRNDLIEFLKENYDWRFEDRISRDNPGLKMQGVLAIFEKHLDHIFRNRTEGDLLSIMEEGIGFNFNYYLTTKLSKKFIIANLNKIIRCPISHVSYAHFINLSLTTVLIEKLFEYEDKDAWSMFFDGFWYLLENEQLSDNFNRNNQLTTFLKNFILKTRIL